MGGADDDEPDAAQPAPPDAPGRGEVAVGVAALAGLIAIDVASDGLLSALSAIPAPGDQGGGDPHDDPRIQEQLAGTAPPRRDAAGNAQCTTCGRWVAFPSMSLCAHGYLCPACAHAT